MDKEQIQLLNPTSPKTQLNILCNSDRNKGHRGDQLVSSKLSLGEPGLLSPVPFRWCLKTIPAPVMPDRRKRMAPFTGARRFLHMHTAASHPRLALPD